LLHSLAHAFSAFKATTRVEFYVKRLIENDYNLEEINKAVESCIATCKTFPNLPEITSIISSVSTKQLEINATDTKLVEHKIEMLQKDTTHLKKMFLHKYSEETLRKWISVYCRSVYPKGNFARYNIGINLFESVFFQDLVKGKTLYKAIQEGKNERKRNRKCNTPIS